MGAEFRRGKPAGDLQRVKPFRGHGTTIFFCGLIQNLQNGKNSMAKKSKTTSRIWLKSIQVLSITFVDEVAKQTHDLSHPGGIRNF